MLSPELLIAAGSTFVSATIFIVSSHHTVKANSENIKKLDVKIDKLAADTNARFDKVDARFDKMEADTKAQFAEINKVLLQNSQDVGYLIGLQSGDSFFKRRRAQMGSSVVREIAEAQA